MLFLQLYLAHLITDFVVRPDWIAKNKQKLLPLTAHAAIYLGNLRDNQYRP